MRASNAKRVRCLCLGLLAGCLPFRVGFADWLVIASNSPHYADYQLLPDRSMIALDAGEHLLLLHDDGSEVDLVGPVNIDLASRRDAAKPGKLHGDGLAGRLASLLAAPDRHERPGVSRSASMPGAAQSRPPGTIDINLQTGHCLAAEDPMILSRQPQQSLTTAQVAIDTPGAATVQQSWYAGFDTLSLDRPDGAGRTERTLRVTVRQGLGAAKILEIEEIPAHLPLAQRLERMLAAGCREAIERELHRVTTSAARR